MKIIVIVNLIICSILLSGCFSLPKDTVLIGGGAAAGTACGYALDKGHIRAPVIGATGGAALTSTLLAREKKSVQRGFDMGYIQGASDAIKRHYWMCQELHKQVSSNEKLVYLSIPGPTITEDGRKLVPHNVMVPIVE